MIGAEKKEDIFVVVSGGSTDQGREERESSFSAFLFFGSVIVSWG